MELVKNGGALSCERSISGGVKNRRMVQETPNRICRVKINCCGKTKEL
jgi:hypothetical protein